MEQITSIVGSNAIKKLKQVQKHLEIMCNCETELNKLGIFIEFTKVKVRDDFFEIE